MLRRLPRALGSLTAVLAGVTALGLIPAAAATGSARLDGHATRPDATRS